MREEYIRLINLIKENPNLRILPMVDCEICNSDYNTCIGSIGKSYIEEITNYEIYGEESIIQKSNIADIEEYLDNETSYTEKEKEKIIKELDWEKVIILDINLPD